MCELLGLNFNKPVRPTFSFPSLLSNSDWNADGWGIGYHHDDKSATVFKEPKPGNESELTHFLKYYPHVESSSFILHIRRASRGDISQSNTHPFCRHYRSNQMLFAHNGTLTKKFPFPRHSFHPTGTTDSESAFCFLLGQMEAKNILPIRRGSTFSYSQEQIEKIYDILLQINENGAFNTIFSDGRTMFAYRDAEGARELYFIKRKYPFTACRYRDSDVEVNLPNVKEEHEEGYIIASQPLTDEVWEEFKPGQLIAFSMGEIVADIY